MVYLLESQVVPWQSDYRNTGSSIAAHGTGLRGLGSGGVGHSMDWELEEIQALHGCSISKKGTSTFYKRTNLSLSVTELVFRQRK